MTTTSDIAAGSGVMFLRYLTVTIRLGTWFAVSDHMRAQIGTWKFAMLIGSALVVALIGKALENRNRPESIAVNGLTSRST